MNQKWNRLHCFDICDDVCFSPTDTVLTKIQWKLRRLLFFLFIWNVAMDRVIFNWFIYKHVSWNCSKIFRLLQSQFHYILKLKEQTKTTTRSQFSGLGVVWTGHIKTQGTNARKGYCGCVYSAHILKAVLSGRNL